MLLWTFAALSLLVLAGGSLSSCPLTEPISIHKDNNLFLEHILDTAENTYTMRVSYVGGHAWVGIGRNRLGINAMAPAYAVIGRAESTDKGNVQFYKMVSHEEDGSGVIPMVDKPLQNTSFVQTFDEDGQELSVLTFTQSVTDMGVTDQSVWIYAVGLPGNQWAGVHTVHGGFKLPLTACDPDSGTVNTTTEQLIDVPTLPPHDSHDETDTDNSEAGLGGDVSNEIVFLDTSHPYQTLWLVHGILLAIAWGVLAPLAIGASLLLRKRPCLRLNWYNWHFYLNICVVVLTAIGFILAVVATEKEGNPHFRVDGRSNDVHPKAGLAIMILVVVQAVVGYFRPAASAPAPVTIPNDAPNDEEENPATLVPKKDDTNDVRKESTNSDSSSPVPKCSAEIIQTTDDNNEPAKLYLNVRIVWEWLHRLSGMVLLGLAWYNCHSGCQWQVENWSDSKDWTNIFWGITAGISGAIFVLAYVMRM